jgi:hypothetical protein
MEVTVHTGFENSQLFSPPLAGCNIIKLTTGMDKYWKMEGEVILSKIKSKNTFTPPLAHIIFSVIL